MKGVWAFLKTREWSVAVVPPFDPDLIFITKPWASVLYLVVLFLELIVSVFASQIAFGIYGFLVGK